MSVFSGFLFATLTALLVIAGDVVIKNAADVGRLVGPRMGLGILAYAASAVCWFFTMRNISLGQGAVAYSMLTLVAVVVIGALWLDEAIGPRQIAGLVCALAAMILMAESA